MHQILEAYLNKNIKLHIGPEWSFFGDLISINVADDVACLKTGSGADIVVRISTILALTHVPEAHRNFDRCPESEYHPKPRAYRR